MADHRASTGLLLINLGTPDSPAPADVGRYLKQFLMDPYVLRTPWLVRWFLVNVLIVPRRSHASSELYRNIWTEAGSPLLVNSVRFRDKMARALAGQYEVALAMRYGSPSIEQGVRELIDRGVERITIFPLYPHFALSSVETCLAECQEVLDRLGVTLPVDFIEEFYDAPSYITALTETVREVMTEHRPDYVLFSFHGLPESHVKATDPGQHCFATPDCCERFKQAAPKCYRAQCYLTAKLVAQNLALPRQSVSFQSRLGREPWLLPDTEVVVADLARQGVKRLAVACPAFTADCLETLEEISFRARDIFLKAGGEELVLVPSLNDRDVWVEQALHLVAGWPRRALSERVTK